jgi:hypothetical protein
MTAFIKVTFSHAEAQTLHEWDPGKQVSHNGEPHRVICSVWCTDGSVRYTLELADAAVPLHRPLALALLKWCTR